MLHAIGQALEKNIQTDVIYLDFAKAFDSVDHTILLAKLRVYEVSEQLLAWFTDYLTGRAQRVVLDDATPQWAPASRKGACWGHYCSRSLLTNSWVKL